MKEKLPKFDVWVKRTHTFTATVSAKTLEDAVILAKNMNEQQLLDAPGEEIDSEHELTAVMKS
jgi:hypothetical protein